MPQNPHDTIFTLGIGGAAGDGVREAGQSVGQLLCELGYEVFLSNTYPSLIRGGHNFTRLSFSKEKVFSDHQRLDILIALNEETISLHKKEVDKDTIVLADRFESLVVDFFGKNAVAVPMASSVAASKAPAITRNSVALGAVCYLLDLDFTVMVRILGDVFKNKMPDLNIKLAEIGYEHLKALDFRHPKKLEPAKQKKELVDGNEAFGRGLIAAGLDFYIGYPMTPITGLLHFLAGCSLRSLLKEPGLLEERPQGAPPQVLQPESELAVANMALGVAYAGKRVAIGSATGGFMLMEEAFSFAGMAELPLVVAVAERQAPATGVPTYSSQTDLRLAIHSGHGEFPRIVIIPGDPEEAFELGALALNLSWKYQIPVIVLLDKIVCEHSATSILDSSKIIIERGLIAGQNGTTAKSNDVSAFEITNKSRSHITDQSGFEAADFSGSNTNSAIGSNNPSPDPDAANKSESDLNSMAGQNYGRYELTKSGISPMAFPGTPNTVVKVTSYEHDQNGMTADEAEPVKAMIDKRFRKGETILAELGTRQTLKTYGDPNSNNVVVFWGSTKGPVLEAAKYLKAPVKFLQIIWAEPFDAKKVAAALHGAKNIINIECNHNAQMASLIREKTGIEVTHNILRYDSRPFDPMELAEEMNTLIEN